MAIQNPSGLYTGGAVVVDQPNLGLYAQHLHRKQARDEALNQYFTELGDKINMAGVRMQDLTGPMGGINDDISQWRQNWLANKDAIKKGGMAQQEHMAKLNQIIRKIDQSKQRGKLELDIGKSKFEGKYDPDDDDLHVLENIGKSIYDPQSYKQDGVTEYGWQDLSPAVPEFDVKKQNEFWTTASRGLKPGRVFDETNMRVDKTTGKAFVPFKEIYSPDQIKKISDDAIDLVKGDRSARKYYNKILDNPKSDQWQRLNSAYQGIYGPTAMVSTPEQAAQADLILKASGIFDSGEQLVTDQDAAFQRSMARMLYNSNLIAARGSGSSNPNEQTIVDAFNQINTAFDDPSTELPLGLGRGVEVGKLPQKAQESVIMQANKLANNLEIDPNDAEKLKNVKFYQNDLLLHKAPNGDISLYDKNQKRPIVKLDFTGTNLGVQPSVKEKREVIKVGSKQPAQRTSSKYKIKGKDYSEKELLDMGYTIEQIAQYKQ